MTRSVARVVARAVVMPLAIAALLAPMSSMPVRGADSTCAAPTAPADTMAPTQPGNFHVVSRARSGSITLGWTASYDAVGVAGYRLYRNGSWQGTLCQAGVDLLGTVWPDRLGGRIKTAVTYELYAFDAAGNDSAAATLVVTP
jgi:hypothetical protein